VNPLKLWVFAEKCLEIGQFLMEGSLLYPVLLLCRMGEEVLWGVLKDIERELSFRGVGVKFWGVSWFMLISSSSAVIL
jgi:hypothetical protein